MRSSAACARRCCMIGLPTLPVVRYGDVVTCAAAPTTSVMEGGNNTDQAVSSRCHIPLTVAGYNFVPIHRRYAALLYLLRLVVVLADRAWP